MPIPAIRTPTLAVILSILAFAGAAAADQPAASRTLAADSPANPAGTPAAADTSARPSAADALIEQAEAKLARGETQPAIEQLRQAVAADPTSSRAQTRLGGAYLLDQHYLRAIDHFQQAIGLDEDNAGAFIGLGVAYLHLQALGPARAALNEARRLAPEKSPDIDALLSGLEPERAQRPPP